MGAEFWLESLKEIDHSQDQGVDGRRILIMDLMEIGFGDVDCIHLAHDMDCEHGNKLSGPIKGGVFLH
jgi:hypothetical protein